MLRLALCMAAIAAAARASAPGLPATASRGHILAPATCRQPFCMLLRGGGKNKDHRRHTVEGAGDGEVRNEKIAERVAVAAEELQEKLKLAREEVKMEVCSCGFSAGGLRVSQRAGARDASGPEPQLGELRRCAYGAICTRTNICRQASDMLRLCSCPPSARRCRRRPRLAGCPTWIGRPPLWKHRWSRRESFPRNAGATKN